MQKQQTITIGGVETLANYPNVGDLMKIENIKMDLTGGSYGQLATSGHYTALALLDAVDAFSYFAVLAPKLELKMDEFEKMETEQVALYIAAYKNELKPWISEVEQKLRVPFMPPKKKVETVE